MYDCVIIWTAYMEYRLKLRGFKAENIEECVRYSTERYNDIGTGRRIAIGHCGNKIIMVAYECEGKQVTPVTVHVTSRQQINARITARRFVHA